MTSNHKIPRKQEELAAWIMLQEASALLGVAESTLRRWGDAGRVPMKRTFGGHRRFQRTAIMRLAESLTDETPRSTQYTVPRGWGINEHELTRQTWHAQLASRPIGERMRELGQRLLGLLIQYIGQCDDDSRFLSEAREVGVSYGHESRTAGISLYNTIEAFLFFRSAFSQLATPPHSSTPANDLAEAVAMHTRIEHFMDGVLLGTIAGYQETA